VKAVLAEDPGDFPGAELAASVGMADRAFRVAQGDCVLDRPRGKRELHADVDRVANDPVREHVLDRTEIELPSPGWVFGYVGQPDLVRSRSGEPVPDPATLILCCQEIVVNGRAGFPGLPHLLRVGSP